MGQFSILSQILFTRNPIVDILTVVGVLAGFYGVAMIHPGLIWVLLGFMLTKVASLHHLASARVQQVNHLMSRAEEARLAAEEQSVGQKDSHGNYV